MATQGHQDHGPIAQGEGTVTYDHAIIRVVPKVERQEFVNVGVIVSCPARGFPAARIELDEQRLMALDSTLDVESIRAHLATIPLFVVAESRQGRSVNSHRGSASIGSLHLEAP